MKAAQATFDRLTEQAKAVDNGPLLAVSRQAAGTIRIQQESVAAMVRPALEQYAVFGRELDRIMAQLRPALYLAVSPELQRAVAQAAGLSSIMNAAAIKMIDAYRPHMESLAKAVMEASQLAASIRPYSAFTVYGSEAVRGWRQTVDAAVLAPVPPRAARLVALGGSTLEVVKIGNELGTADDDPATSDSDERWRDGREHLTDDLAVWLVVACPKAVPKLKGAWHALTSDGPDAASQAANSGVETLDWTLRTIAPDEAVLAWREGIGKYEDEVEAKNGKPHRRLRVRYIVRDYGLDSDGVAMITMMVTKCLNELQGIKHGVDPKKTKAAARRGLLALENTLLSFMPH